MLKRYTLSTLFSFSAAIILTLSAILFIAYTTTQNRENASRAALQTLQSQAQTDAAAIDVRLAAIGTDLIALLQSTPIQNYTNTQDPTSTLDNARTFLTNYLNDHTQQYSGLCLLDSSGQEQLCLNDNQGTVQVLPTPQLHSLATETYFKNALTTSSPYYLSDAQTDPQGNLTIFYALLPLTKNNSVTGTL